MIEPVRRSDRAESSNKPPSLRLVQAPAPVPQIAERLRVPAANIFANTLLFDASGDFAGAAAPNSPAPLVPRASTRTRLLRRHGRPRQRRTDIARRRQGTGARGEMATGSRPLATLLRSAQAQVVIGLKASRGYNTVVMIGDGATDMEALMRCNSKICRDEYAPSG